MKVLGLDFTTIFGKKNSIMFSGKWIASEESFKFRSFFFAKKVELIQCCRGGAGQRATLNWQPVKTLTFITPPEKKLFGFREAIVNKKKVFLVKHFIISLPLL